MADSRDSDLHRMKWDDRHCLAGTVWHHTPTSFLSQRSFELGILAKRIMHPIAGVSWERRSDVDHVRAKYNIPGVYIHPYNLSE
jgi:hypothetical protein